MCQPISANGQFQWGELGFLHHETYNLVYWTFCPNYPVAVVFVNRLLLTPPGLEVVSRKWGCLNGSLNSNSKDRLRLRHGKFRACGGCLEFDHRCLKYDQVPGADFARESPGTDGRRAYSKLRGLPGSAQHIPRPGQRWNPLSSRSHS